MMLAYNGVRFMKNTKTMFWVFASFVLIFQLMHFLAMPIFVSSVFAQRDAIIAHFKLEALPTIQGVNGTIKIKASIGFAAPCCEGAEAHDVTVTLVAPKQLKLIEGKEQQTSPIVVCDAPGVEVYIQHEWIVSAALQGNYTVEVHLTSKNAGGGNKAYTLQFVEGPPISSPTVNPQKPSINDEIEIEVTTPIAYVNRVLLNYSMNGGLWTFAELNKVDSDRWNAVVEKQNEGVLTFYFGIQTIHNETFRSPIYELKVRNFARIAQWQNISSISYLGLLTAGIIAIFLAGRKLRRRRRTKPERVQSILRDRDEIDYERPEFPEEIEAKPGIKWYPVTILIALGITLLVAAILLKEFEQLMPYLEGVPT